MRASRSRSINRKLSRLVVLAIGLAMTFVAVLGLWQEATYYLEGKRDTLLATAGAFAAASADAVAQKDEAAGYRAIRGIAAVPTIQFASLTDDRGQSIADIGSGARLQGDLDLSDRDRGTTPLSLLMTRTVSVSVAVKRDGRDIGRLALVSDVSDLWSRLWTLIAVDTLGAVGALTIGLCISLRMQRAITRPLIKLAAVMAAVQTSFDYGASVAIESDDEIGTLASSFNAMLGEVRERDRRLIAHRDRLEQDVAERTADLKVAKEEAEDANTAKSTFLATMSHEIRTPMNGMMVMAELLAGSHLPERQRRYAEVIARSGQSLLAIINDILDLSKIEAGKLTLESIDYAPSDVIDTVITLFAERANGKGLDLAAFVAPDVPPTMLGDQVRLTQVLSNLVNNALKFTAQGHVLVSADCIEGRLRLAVSDTGIGIPSDKIEGIFEAFSQADQTTTRRFGGTGLGLSIARRIVSAMGGRIEVMSVDGQGSCFSLSLPLAARPVPIADHRRPPRPVGVRLKGTATSESVRRSLSASGFDLASTEDAEPRDLVADTRDLLHERRRTGAGRVVGVAAIDDASAAEALRRGLADTVIRWPIVQEEWREVLAHLRADAPFAIDADSVKAAGAKEAVRFKGAHVLVADDSAVNREVACEALARLDVTAEAVESGRAAIDAIGARVFDLILMDGSMPDMDGYEATRAIRDEEARTGRPHLPIIALTAHVVGASADLWRQAGMDDVLHKPFTVGKLADVLGRYLAADGFAGKDAPDVERAPPPPAEAADGEAFDLLDLETIAGIVEMAGAGDAHAFWRRIVQLFADGGPPGFAALRDAVARSDVAAAASAAHKLKSTSLNIGGTRLAKMLAAMEAMALDQAVLPTAEGIDRAERCFADTNAALEDGHFAEALAA